MPTFMVPFGIVLGVAVAVYGLKRPAAEFADDRRRSAIGYPFLNLIARLPLPVARAIWVGLGAMIVLGAIVAVFR